MAHKYPEMSIAHWWGVYSNSCGCCMLFYVWLCLHLCVKHLCFCAGFFQDETVPWSQSGGRFRWDSAAFAGWRALADADQFWCRCFQLSTLAATCSHLQLQAVIIVAYPFLGIQMLKTDSLKCSPERFGKCSAALSLRRSVKSVLQVPNAGCFLLVRVIYLKITKSYDLIFVLASPPTTLEKGRVKSPCSWLHSAHTYFSTNVCATRNFKARW